MSQWLPFEGRADDNGSSFRPSPSKGDGVVDLDKDAVRVSGDKVEVLVGATARVVWNPSGKHGGVHGQQLGLPIRENHVHWPRPHVLRLGQSAGRVHRRLGLPNKVGGRSAW